MENLHNESGSCSPKNRPFPGSTVVVVSLVEALLERARDEVLDETGIRVFSRLRGVSGQGSSGRPDECYFEWNMGPANGAIEDEVFVDAWRRFIEAIERHED